MRAHPLGVGLLVVASGLSIATRPVPPPEVGVETPPRAGVLTAAPDAPATLRLLAQLSCATPDEDGSAYPGDGWIDGRFGVVTAPEEPPDALVVVQSFVDGVEVRTEPYAVDDLRSFAMDFGWGWERSDCRVGEPCELELDVVFTPEVSVELAWEARAGASWYERDGVFCLVFLFER